MPPPVCDFNSQTFRVISMTTTSRFRAFRVFQGQGFFWDFPCLYKTSFCNYNGTARHKSHQTHASNMLLIQWSGSWSRSRTGSTPLPQQLTLYSQDPNTVPRENIEIRPRLFELSCLDRTQTHRQIHRLYQTSNNDTDYQQNNSAIYTHTIWANRLHCTESTS